MPMSTTKGIDKLGERQYHIGVNIEFNIERDPL